MIPAVKGGSGVAAAVQPLGTRGKHLLLALLHKDGPVVIAALAKQFGVSPRSIRYDLDEIEVWLGNTPIRLCRRPRVGIWVEGAEGNLALAREKLGLVEDYRPVLSPEQRRNIIVARLLQHDEPVTSHALADELHVSRTTVFADLDNVQAWLGERGLSLVRRSNYGLRIMGEETAWRQAVSDLLNDFAESGELGRLLMQIGTEPSGGEDSLASGFAGSPHLLALLGGLSLRQVEELVRLAEDLAGVEFTTGSYSSLVFQLAIAIGRLTHGKQVELPRDRMAALRSYAEYTLAGRLAQRATEIFGVALPEAEVGHLTLHLIGAKVRGPARGRTTDKTGARPGILPAFDIEAAAAARLIIASAARELGLPLGDAEGLLPGLALHLRPALGRLRFGLPMTNPLLAEIRALYPRIYAAAEQACREIGPIVGLSIPAEEVGYVTMHLGAAIIRRRQVSSGRRRVVVASTGGVGVNEMLAARLGAEFPELEVAATSSVHGLHITLTTSHPDFVISTSSVPGVEVEVVVVDPLLNTEDIARVRAFLDRRYSPSEHRLLSEAD